MLKQAAFVLILLILIMVGFVLAERAFVPSFQQCIAQQQKTEADTSSEKNPSRFSVIIDAHVRCSGAFIERHNGSLTALATIFIALFTFTLWQSSEKMWAITKSAAESAKRSADVAEHSLTIVERAFITISDISITTIAQHRTIIDHRIHINVINSGRTPAKNYASQTNLVVLDDIPDDFRFADRPHEELAKTVVGPQSRTYILVDFFIQDAIATYQKNKKTLIYGWIEYDDIFPHTGTHRTEFCIAVEVFADPRETPEVIYGKSIPIMTLRPYGRYNAYDDDCLYRPGQTPVAREGELPPLTQPPTVSPPAGLPSETGT